MARDHLAEFAESVRKAPFDKLSERIVRIMLENVAKDCPMNVLVALGRELIKCEEAKRNN